MGKSKPARLEVAREPSWLERQLQEHTRAIAATLASLRRRWVGTLLTAFVIGITLALPAGLHALLANIGNASGAGLQGTLRASLFLKDNVSTQRGQALTVELARRAGVSAAHYLSREDALAEFKAGSGYAQALDLLKDNPLPATITVTADARQPQERTAALFKELAALPEVEHAKLDEKWLQRLYAILHLVQRAVLIVSSALALTVVVVIGNTIRLDIENRRQEIEVMKLIGADDSFIRRPFLYTGLWYGLSGALLGCLLVEGAALALAAPAQSLAGLYGSQLSFSGLTASEVGAVFGVGAALGWSGAWWAVSQRLYQIIPD